MISIKENFSNLIKEQSLNVSDDPFVVKNFLKTAEDYLNWNTLNEAINDDVAKWELIDQKTKTKIAIPWHLPFWTRIPQQDKQFISEQVNSGVTFVVVKCCTLNTNFKALISDIQETFPVACDLHIYGSKGTNSTSFRPHSDRHSNFIIQAVGDTDWKVFKNRISSILPWPSFGPEPHEISARAFDTKLTPSLEVTLSPGDLLYIPPRTYHVALPSMPRLSMSIPCMSLDNFSDLEEYLPKFDQAVNRIPVDVNKYEI